MPNLLQKASIVLTPTAYNDGEVLCAKPSKPPYGDFDFSRNSAATRVNAQGLVENVQILSSNLVQNGNFSEEGVQEISNGSFSQEGAELITNGDFTNGTTGWSSNATLTESNNIANITTTSTATVYIRQNNVYEFGKRYKLTFTAKVDNLTEFELYVGSTNAYISTGIIPTQTTDFQEYNFYFQADTAGGMNLLLRQSMVANSSIEYSEISVREVGQDWNLGTGWSIGEDKALADLTSSNDWLSQTNVFTSGKIYKVSFEVLDYTSGSINLSLHSAWSQAYSANGVYTNYLTATGVNLKFSSLANNFNGSITNISVKEVGMDWTLGTGWSIGENKAISDGTQGLITQTDVGGAGVTATYKVQWTQNITTGTRLRFFARNYNDGGNATILSITRDDGTSISGGNCVGSGTFTAYVSSTNGYSFKILAETGVEADITNITTIEITHDTNLPRINYEGFSYQDALGSELVTNGGFDTDSDWDLGTGWTISGGSANCDGVGFPYIRQNNVLVSGKTYLLTFDITSYTSGSIKYEDSVETPIFYNALGSYSQTFTADSNNCRFQSASFIGSIDNVSVKEYLGQSVVPNSGCGSWLFEPQSTNLISYSEDFSQSYWQKSNSSVIPNSAISPDGTFNSALVVGTAQSATSSYIRATTTAATTIGETYTLSLYVKPKGGSKFFKFWARNTDASFVIFNLVDGTTDSPTTSTITAVGGGWFRVTTTGVLTTATVAPYFYTYYSATESDGFYIWAAQIEQGNISSYIPTSGSTVTRNKDVCNNGGSLATINSTEGVLYWEGAKLQAASGTQVIGLSDGGTANRISFQTTTTANQIMFVVDAGGQQASESFIVSDITDYNKFALKWKQDDFSFWINGIKVGTDTSGNVPPLNALNTLHFYYGTGIFNFFGKTKAVAVWKEALSDQELADLTYPTPTDPTFTLDFDTIAEQFTFARGSEATYVDAQGLIQSTNELGAEEITNGDFEDGSTGWTFGAGWNVVDGRANFDTDIGTTPISQSNVFELTKTYSISLDVTLLDGELKVYGWAGTDFTITESGSYEFIAPNANGTTLNIRRNTTPTSGSIDNVSVKEVISATNTPRLDYSTGAEAFLLEPQSTNLLPQSQDLNTGWATGNSSVVANSAISPDGTINAFKLVENTATASHNVYFNSPNTPTTNGVTYTMSFFAKAAERTRLRNTNAAESSQDVIYDLSSGTIVSEGANIIDSNIIDYGNGWYRCIMSFVSTTTIAQTNVGLMDGITQAYPGDGVSGAYLWGFQTEAQSYATSYIPTNGSQTTRNQETCINATPEINSEEGVLYAEISALADDGDAFRLISLNDGTANNVVYIGYDAVANRITFSVRVATSYVFLSDYNISNATDTIKVAISYKLNDFKFYLNGVLILADTSGVIFPTNTLTKLSFDRGGALPFYGNTKDIQVYTKALSDAELIKLTT